MINLVFFSFTKQEMKRFSNPHKAFTYRLHGYESVVGPIKGVYNKESSAVKAREHALLVNERPACVNILTLGLVPLLSSLIKIIFTSRNNILVNIGLQ